MKQPRVSIIIPVFNGQNYLNQAVQSVLRQTYTDWELLLIDDGSTDESVPMAKRYAACHPEKIRCLEHPGHSNQGQLATRILGGQLARADVLALLDQDDIWDEYYLEKHLQLWDTVQSRQVCLSYGPGLYWFPDDRTGSRDFVQPMPPGAPKVYGPAELLESFFSSRYANTPCPSCTLLRRDVLSKVKHFEGLAKGSPCEDQYLWWYLAARWPVSVHCNIWTRYRRHNDSAYFQGTATAQQTGQAELKFLKAIQNDLSVECPDHPLLRNGDLAMHINRLATQGLRNRMSNLLHDCRSIFPKPAKRLARRCLGLVNICKARLRLAVGVEPLSYLWGSDRGLPIHRYYIEEFLKEFAHNIRGHCLEFQNPGYTPRFGGTAVEKLDILHLDATNPLATIVADLTKPNDIPSNRFDCIICTHVLHIIADLDTTVSELYRILKPGGVLLVAVPQVSMCDPGFHELWRFTPEGLVLVLAKAFGEENVTVRAYGNSLTAAGEIRGVVAHEFTDATLNYHDARFAVEVCARACKP